MRFQVHKFKCARVFLALLGICLLGVPLLASCSATDNLQLTPFNLGIPAAALNSPTVGSVPTNRRLHVGITFKINQDLLNRLGSEPPKVGQPSHVEQVANQLGIDDGTYQKIKNFFSAQQLKLELNKLHTHLSIDAKAGTLAKVLQTKFVDHQYQGHTFFAPSPAPKLPKFLVNVITAITGLDNYSSSPQHMNIPIPQHASQTLQPGQDCAPPDQVLLPKEIAHAYGFDQLWNRGWHGENMTVNLVEIDGFYRQDLENYLSCINFQGHIQVVNVDDSPTQAAGESTLDLEMIAGLARSINIVDYQTGPLSDTDVWAQVNDELQQIINDNTNNAGAGSVVSVSLGIDEQQMTTDDLAAIDQSLRELTQVEHMRVFIASGDCGAFASGDYRDLSVSFPASDPWATSVGGTVLQVNNSSARANEVTWSDGSNISRCKNQWGSGGGNSQVYGHPGWQQARGLDNQYSRGNHRQIPDISAVAFALAVFFQGQWVGVGGTSAAAPIWATGMALVNQGLIQQKKKFTASPQLFYQVANAPGNLHPYFDVTRGNNLYFPATQGWDYATGLGTPNLGDFYQALFRQV